MLIIFSIFRPEIKQIDDDVHTNLLITQSQNVSAKIAILTEAQVLRTLDYFFIKSTRWYKLPEYTFQVSQLGLVLTANHFLFENVDKMIQRLTSSGIMKFILNKCILPKVNLVVGKTSSVLTLKDLSFGFVIWLSFCGVCFCVFMFESIFWILNRKIENLMKKEKKLEVRKVKYAKVHPVGDDRSTIV